MIKHEECKRSKTWHIINILQDLIRSIMKLRIIRLYFLTIFHRKFIFNSRCDDRFWPIQCACAIFTSNRINNKWRTCNFSSVICKILFSKMTLNPLANPKGIKLLCELCQKPAFIQCTKCRVTYYWWVK